MGSSGVRPDPCPAVHTRHAPGSLAGPIARTVETMDEQSPRRSDALDHEMVERTSTAGWSVVLVLFRPVPRFRSPIMERRPNRPQPADPDRRGLTVPAARDVIRPIGWAMLLAIPILVVVGWQAALLVGAISAIAREVDGRIARSSLSFADGFLGFRADAGWPNGVQEDDEVRWNWSRAGNGQAAHG